MQLLKQPWLLAVLPLILGSLLAQRPTASPAEDLNPNEPGEDDFMIEEILSEADFEGEKSEIIRPVQEAKYNRRVMLMVFINESKNENLEYLGISVADAFSVPLMKTGNFVILNRDSVNRYVTTMGISRDDVYSAENATRLGKAIGADVVVVGKYVSVGDSVIIDAKAVDVQAGLVSVEDSEQIKTDTSMFNAINKLAERMSGPMAEKMKPLETPPPPAEVILDEKQVAEEVRKIEDQKAKPTLNPIEIFATERRVYVEPGLSLLIAPGTSGKQLTYDGRYAFGALNPGFAGAISFQSSLPQWTFLNGMRWLDYLASIEYARYSSSYEILSSTGQTLLESETMRFQVFGAAFSLGHDFAVWNFLLTPYAGASMEYASFSASDGSVLFKGAIPGVNIGCRWRVYQWQAFEVGVNVRSGYRYLNESNSYFNQTFSISGGYRL